MWFGQAQKHRVARPSAQTLERHVFFAYRTKQRLRLAFAVCIAYAVLAAAVAAMLPRAGLGFLESFGWWLCAIPFGLASYVALELFGTWSLDRPFWNRMSSWMRVLLLVTLVSCCAVGAVIVSQFIGSHGSL